MVWINKAEECFSIHNITADEEMIKYASMQLEERAYNQYMWWKVTTQETKLKWRTFENNFFKRFENSKEKDFITKLTRLQQKGDVDEYTDICARTHRQSTPPDLCVWTKTLYKR